MREGGQFLGGLAVKAGAICSSYMVNQKKVLQIAPGALVTFLEGVKVGDAERKESMNTASIKAGESSHWISPMWG
jgi:hypothetical protein